MLSPEMAERTCKSIPLRTPEEIAGLAYFLLLDDATFINEEVIITDEGQ